MSDIVNERWVEVVKNSPYVFLTDEMDSYAQEVKLYALDKCGGLDESRPMGSTFMPNLYFGDTKSPFKYFVSRTAFHADVNYVGEFFYSTYDYDTDYPELEDTGFDGSVAHTRDFSHELSRAYVKLKISINSVTVVLAGIHMLKYV